MPRYYFDLTENGHVTPDERGLEVDDLKAAERSAQLGLSEMVAGAMPDGEHKVMSLQILDQDGRTPFRVTITMQVDRKA